MSFIFIGVERCLLCKIKIMIGSGYSVVFILKKNKYICCVCLNRKYLGGYIRIINGDYFWGERFLF